MREHRPDTEGKLSLKTKICYGLGDIYGGGVFNIVNIFYAMFLTDVCDISAVWAANIVLIAKIWDAVSDPLMGVISDNTRSRFGRRRPYFMAGMPMILLSFMMLWYPAGFPNEGLRVMYAMFAYLLLNTVVTLVMVPYMAFGAEISLDSKERSSVSAIQLCMSLISTLLCALLPTMIISAFAPDVRKGYIIMSLCFGLFFSVPWVFVIGGTRERSEFQNVPRVSLSKALLELRSTFGVKTFLRLVILFLTNSVAFDLMSMLFTYYMKYSIENYAMLNIVLGTIVVSQIAALPLVLTVSRRIGKIKCMVLGSLAWILLCAMLVFFRPHTPVWMLFALAAMLGVSICFTIVMERSIFGDVTDIGEYKLGKRMEGSFSGTQTFLRKCSTAAANWIALTVLGRVGYISSAGDGFVEQTSTVVFAIRGMIAFLPALFIGLGLLAAIKWPVSSAIQDKLSEYLKSRRAGTPDNRLERELEQISSKI